MKRETLSQKIFDISNSALLILLAVICILPLINVLAVSFSSTAAAMAGKVKFLPVDFSFVSYEFALQKVEFWRSFVVSLERVIVGTIISLFLVIITSYALSKNERELKFRNIYMWFIFFTTLFSGGLIPLYMTVKSLNLIDSFWVLVLYYVIPPFHVIIMLNFFRQIPEALSEAAFMDGAGHWKILWHVIVPVSKPAIATIVLLTAVFHWTSWLDGIMFINDPQKYPLQAYLQNLVVIKDAASMQNLSKEDLESLSAISDRTTKAAQIFLSTFPILLVYPFLQRFFIKGIALGSVKG